MKYIDLSHPIFDAMPTYTSDPEVSIERIKDIKSHSTLLHSFSLGTHTGTHLDAPAHVIINGKTIDNFDLSAFTGLAIKVDQKSFDRLNVINNNKDTIKGVLFDTGWYKNYNNPEIYYGIDRPEIPKPLINKLKDLGIKFFGCDLPSVDISGSKNKPIHNSLLGNNIIIYESLTNLDQIPLNEPFQFFGFPLPFMELDGSPVRAVACIE